MISEAIILAGGLGTRLRSVVTEIPKSMAPVAGVPFLQHIIEYLKKQGIERFIFSLGYKHAIIETFLHKQYASLNKRFSIETEPLGTGGALKLACTKARDENILVVNGDTLFYVDVNKLNLLHITKNADCTLSLKPMQNFDRYGIVEIREDNAIASFKEKKWYNKGLINGGLYALNVPRFKKEILPEKFSFEKNYLEQFFTKREMHALIQDEYFIDIGIPGDYQKANNDLACTK